MPRKTKLDAALDDMQQWLIESIAMGLHSNIPFCCVQYFVDTPPEVFNRRRNLNVGYVPCDAAGQRKPAQVHRCMSEACVQYLTRRGAREQARCIRERLRWRAHHYA